VLVIIVSFARFVSAVSLARVGVLPEFDESAFILDYWAPPGASLAETDRICTMLKKN